MPEATIARPRIDLWHFAVEELLQSRPLNEWRSRLSPSQTERAKRYLLDAAKVQYIVSHAVLREVLSGYLMTDASEIEFQHTRFGKPVLEGTTLAFNVSHSDGQILVAVSWANDLGVDIQKVDKGVDSMAIADFLFSAREMRQWLELAPDLRWQSLYDYWCCKEAFVKALGYGFFYAPRGIELGTEMGRRIDLEAFFFHDDMSQCGDYWCIKNIELRGYGGCKAALAHRGLRHSTISCRAIDNLQL